MSLTTINIDTKTLSDLATIASRRALSREETLREAIARLRAEDLRLEAMVKKGRESAEKGETYTQEQIEAENERIRREIVGKICK